MNRYELVVDNPRLGELQRLVVGARADIIGHSIYSTVTSSDDVRKFMEYHVFAVWDFMSLLKRLQQALTCVQTPWVPVGTGTSRRLINEIVLVEESDEYDGGFLSHFELYRLAMVQAGADDSAIASFLQQLDARGDVRGALESADVPEAASRFVRTTWDILENAPVHAQAAAFAFARENLIPSMFQQLTAISEREGLSLFQDYLVRHVAVDEEEHTPMAMQLVIDLCGDDTQRWSECGETVRLALDARRELWDVVADLMSVRA